MRLTKSLWVALGIGAGILSGCDTTRTPLDRNGVEMTGDGRTLFPNGETPTQPNSSQTQTSQSFWSLFPGSYRTKLKSGSQVFDVSVSFGSETLQDRQYGRLRIQPLATSSGSSSLAPLDLYLVLADFKTWDASTVSYTIQSNIVMRPDLVYDHMAIQFDAVFRYSQATGWKFEPTLSWLTVIDCAFLVCTSASYESQFTEALK